MLTDAKFYVKAKIRVEEVGEVIAAMAQEITG